MSSIQERKYFLQLWRFTTGPAIDVIQLHFEVKELNNITFENFLNDPLNKHILFHQRVPTIPCCECAKLSLASGKKRGCLIQQQFDQLYDNSGQPRPNHEKMTGSNIQHCLCKFSAKCSVTVDELDITLFDNVVEHCKIKMNRFWRKNIKDVRNYLAHVANGQVKQVDFEDKWKTLSDATLGFAGEISNKCKKMTKEVILEIENSSMEALKEKLEKSNVDVMKILDAINGIKQTTVRECRTSAELINNKQDENFNKLQSSFGKSDEILKESKETTTEVRKLTGGIQEINNKVDSLRSTIMVDNLESIICCAVEKAMKSTTANTLIDDSRQITVATQVDSSSWDEENTIRNISNSITTKIDKNSCASETFHIKNVEHKCIQLELVAFPDVFKNSHNLRKALTSLVHRLVEAGEINTIIPGNLKINLTVKTQLTREEMAVVYAVFNKSETLEESSGEGMDIKPKLYDGISLKHTLTIDPDSLEKSDLKSEIANMDDSTVIRNVKMELTDEDKYEEIFVDVDNLRCLLKLTGLPNDLYPSEHEEKSFTVIGNKLFYVEWTMELPLKWNVAFIVSSINGNLTSFHDEFPVDYVYSETNSKLMMHTTAQRCVFRSYSSLEVAVKKLIGKIINVSSIKSNEPEELSASVLIMTKPDEEEFPGEEFNTEVKTDQSIFGFKDDIITCDHCTKDFSCKKCTSKMNHIRILNQALKMKDLTIQRLERALTKREKDMIEDDKSDNESDYSVEKITFNEDPEENIYTPKKAEIAMLEEPEPKKRKTAITLDIAKSKDASKSITKNESNILVDVKQALQKLGEIPLIDFYLKMYRTYLKDLNNKWIHPDSWVFRTPEIKPTNTKEIRNNLLKEKKKRTKLISKLVDVIKNQDHFTTTDEVYDTDIQFLNVGDPTTTCTYCHTKEANQIACYCKDCDIFICNNCVIEHRMTNKNHHYMYQSEILRDYKLVNSWKPFTFSIIDFKFVAADIVAILKFDKLCTYNLTGRLIDTFSIRTVPDSQIACINDCKIAVTVPFYNLIHIFTIIDPITKTELRTPEEKNMTGGITCRMDILFVAFSDAVRLMDLSGQIQGVVNMPYVNIHHSVNNDRMLCLYSKYFTDKTMACFDYTSDRLFVFERFPFHLKDVTTDEVGNIIFTEDGVIWQADSDGKNIKIMISHTDNKQFKSITYCKDSKYLLADIEYQGVKVYRKLE